MLKRTPSHAGLFRLVLGLRWLVLLLLPIQEGAGTGFALGWRLWTAIGIAAAYQLVLTVNARAVSRHIRRSWTFPVVDGVVSLALYYFTGSGTVWPFFLFSAITIIVSGLRGSVRGALVTSLVWNVATALAWVVNGQPVAVAFGISATDDLFNLSLAGGIWAFSVGLMGQLAAARADLVGKTQDLAVANERLDERAQEIVGLLAIGNAILGRVDLGEVLRIVDDALSIMGFGRFHTWIVEENMIVPHRIADGSEAVPVDSPGPLPEAVRRKTVVQLRTGETGEAGGLLPGVEPDTLAIVVPIVADERALGAMVMESVAGDPFSDADVELLELFAEQIALALQHISFHRSARDHAVALERHRISAQISDTIARRISAAIGIAGSLADSAVDARASETLHRVADTLRSASGDLKVVVLNWDSLEWGGTLGDTLRRYIAEFSQLSGIEVDFEVAGEDRHIRPVRAKDLLRILQEALTNVWRHAGPTDVSVALEFTPDAAILSVQDNGVGFDTSVPAAGPGVGLNSINSRGQRNDGRVSVSSVPGEGTQVVVWMPC